MDGMVNKPNKVRQFQQFYQAPSKVFTYARGPRDRVYLITLNVLLAVGLAGTVYGATKMARGKK